MAGRGSIGGRFGSAAPGCVHKVFGERNWECRMKNSECRTRMLKNAGNWSEAAKL